VNGAVGAVRALGANQGRLGVFWHTQGSGKSYSMVFFAQKILRTVPGNWTFVIVTDRQELDSQIYKTFANVGAVTEDEERVHARSAAHLRELLAEDHRYIFTLIQKFRTDDGAAHAVLSARDLLASLKRERLVLDWRKKQQARAGVQVAIEEGLNDLPESYDTARLQQTITAVYQHMYDNYSSAEQSTYTKAA
jgi:hypothetical protein